MELRGATSRHTLERRRGARGNLLTLLRGSLLGVLTLRGLLVALRSLDRFLSLCRHVCHLCHVCLCLRVCHVCVLSVCRLLSPHRPLSLARVEEFQLSQLAL